MQRNRTRSRSRQRKRVLTATERREWAKKKQQEERERFEEACAELATSEGWEAWVRSRAMFHRYSFGNTLLIASQRPDATLVASYDTWKRAGRQVVRGERGIAIRVPVKVKVRTGETTSERPGISDSATIAQSVAARRKSYAEAAADGDCETRTITRFKTGHVFDVSQTDGDDLPRLDRKPITGDSHGGYLPQLEALAGTVGFRVEWRDLADHSTGGWCDRDQSLIVVDSSMPANAQVRALVHEIAHALGVSYKDYGQRLAEVIADTAAFIACGVIGLDTSGESVPYVTEWANGDVTLLREYAETIDGHARKITDALDIDEWAMWSESERVAA